jgi:hypothetical protein
MATLCALST